MIHSELTKVAMIRRADGTLYLNCPCKAEPETPWRTDPNGEVDCSCGRRFTTRGWILPPLEATP